MSDEHKRAAEEYIRRDGSPVVRQLGYTDNAVPISADDTVPIDGQRSQVAVRESLDDVLKEVARLYRSLTLWQNRCAEQARTILRLNEEIEALHLAAEGVEVLRNGFEAMRHRATTGAVDADR